MNVKVIKSENKFPRIMQRWDSLECISMITHQGNKYYETILQDANPLNVGYRQITNLDDWEDFTGEIVLSN